MKTPVVKQQVGAPHEKPVTTLVVQVVLETLLIAPWYQRKALWSFYFQKERTSRKRQWHSDYLRKRLSKLKQAEVEEPKDLLFSVMLTVTFLFGATDLLKEREVKNFHRQTMSRLQIGRAPLTLSSGDSAASFLRTLMLRPAEEPYGTLVTRYDGSFARYLSGKKDYLKHDNSMAGCEHTWLYVAESKNFSVEFLQLAIAGAVDNATTMFWAKWGLQLGLSFTKKKNLFS